MNFAELDAVLLETRERVCRFLELHREVTRVVIHADELVEVRVEMLLGAQAVEEMNRFAARLQKAERLGFQTEMQLAPGLLAQTRDVLDAMPEIRAHGAGLIGMVGEFFERAGQRADAALDVRRQ